MSKEFWIGLGVSILFGVVSVVVNLLEKHMTPTVRAVTLTLCGMGFLVGLGVCFYGFGVSTSPSTAKQNSLPDQSGSSVNQSGGITGDNNRDNTIIQQAFPPPVKEIPPAVFMECKMVALPITIISHSTIHLIAINKKRMQAEKWGFYDVSNDSEVLTTWPEKEKLDLSKHLHNFGMFGWRCEVSSQGPDAIMHLSIPFDFWFDGNKEAVRYEPVVSALDPGKSFSFYIVNDCPNLVAAAWQEIAKIQTLSNPSAYEVKLRKKYRDPTDQVMVFFPSRVQWVRQMPCE